MATAFRILGPLEVERHGEPLPVPGRRRQALLALLLLNANEPVPSERIVDELWGDDPPDTAAKIVQNNVSQLRKQLDPDVLLTRGSAYLLQVEPQELDARRFEALAEEGRRALAAGDAERAATVLHESLALWRGPALADFAYEPFAQTEIARLEEMRLTAIEDRVEADLALGRHGDLVSELEALVARNPVRERLRGHLMLALYRSGRQAEALEAYQAARELLVDELGIEPSPALQRLERAVLQQDASLEPPTTRTPEPRVVSRAPPSRLLRKTVSVVFADLVGVGRSDPEALRRLTELAGERVAGVLAEHGGAVERLASGSVMAVFGVPAAHEDDALRALRAAAESRDALERLSSELGHLPLGARVGVDTGEVVTGGNGTGVTGDVVADAAALAQAARIGDVLVGRQAARLLRTAAELEPSELVAGGPAWRLVGLIPGAPPIPRRLETAMVGRARELGQLTQAFELAVHEQRPYLFTVLGPAGIGKSRLANEFAAAACVEARVLTGRCLPYGTGITFWPLVEIVRQLAGENPLEVVPQLLAGDDDAELIADRIAGLVGAAEGASASEEAFWAVRRLLESVAAKRPLVLLLEDMHWAESTMLDLVEYLADWTRDASLLLLSLARPDLLDLRPTWAGGKLNATTILLQPLSADECRALIANLLADAQLEAPVRNRIVEVAGGNPLFVEQMLAMAAENGDLNELAVPPTIQALLAARLDRLDPDERALLERASVVGKEFWVSAVAELSPDAARPAVGAGLQSLARRELIGSSRSSSFPGEETYSFRHMLIRDAAYESLTKAERADLHERFAGWLEGRTQERDEIAGYHLEQAYRWCLELGERKVDLGTKAAQRLATAGRGAYARGDIAGAVNLLSRAADLLPEGAPERLDVLADLAESLREAGDFKQAEATLAHVSAAAAASHDRALEAYAHVNRLRLQVPADPELETEELEREARAAITVFEAAGDERRLAKAWELLAWALWLQCRAAATEDALQQAIEHARAVGDGRTEAQSLNLSLGAVVFGPMPVAEGIQRCHEIVARTAEQPRIRASALRALAGLLAMEGSFAEARTIITLCRAILEDLGLRVTAASISETAGMVKMLAGDAAAAERDLRAGYEQLEEMGEKSHVADVAARLAQALHQLGEDEEALRFTEISEGASVPGDRSGQVLWRSSRATVLAAAGRLEEAERLAREAVELAAQTDFIVLRADAVLALAEVLIRAGRLSEAEPVVDEAVELYDLKGNAVASARARALLG